MNTVIKYLIFVLVFLSGLFLLWFFRSVMLFIAISAVLSLIFRPLVDAIKLFNYKNIKIGNGLAAFFTVSVIWAFIIVVFWFILPLVGSELQYLSKVDIPVVVDRMWQLLLQAIEPFRENNPELVGLIELQIKDMAVALFDFGHFRTVFASIFDFFGGVFVALFAITFITFFFLKEEGLLVRGILLFIPEHYESGLIHAIKSIRSLLRRYFIGVIIQTLLITILVTVGFYIIGIGFNHAVIVGLVSGLLNIIPYVGPLIGSFFGTIVSIIIYLQTPLDIGFIQLLFSTLTVYAIVQLIDNIVFQPLIFSSSVKAHPLEIFLVILAAGYISGIIGMFLAIPVYTILRVVAREFFFNYRLVQKLTGKL